MNAPDPGAMEIARRQDMAVQAFVHEGQVAGETPEGKILLLRQVLDALIVAAAAPDPANDVAARVASGDFAALFSTPAEYQLFDRASALLRLSLPYSEDDLREFLAILIDGALRRSLSMPLLSQLLRHIERFAEANGLPDSLRPPLQRERERLRPYPGANMYGRMLVRVERLLEPSGAGLPQPVEGWASAMLAFLASLDARSAAKWRALLAHGAAVDQTRPSAKWLQAARARVDGIGPTAFRARALAWLSAAADPCDRVLSERNGVVLKGLAWLCAIDGDPETARVLARLAQALLRWLPTCLDWRGLKAGNACLNALSMMPGPEPLAQLCCLAQRLKGRQLQTSVNRALDVAISRRGLSRDYVEELMVPTHGVEDGGLLHEEVGGVRVDLTVTAAGAPTWRWIVDGAEQTSPPDAIRTTHAGELKALRAAAEEIRATVAAQRARIEGFYLDDRSWSLHEWRARYLAHPLLALLVRALVWEAQTGDGTVRLVLPAGDGFEDVDAVPVSELGPETIIRLWHPLGADPAAIEAWQRRLSAAGLVQPFKQVDRETYALSAEEWGAGASARFAGRVLRQQQFYALCQQRGWQYALQGPWNGGPPYAVRALPRWNVRAELAVDAVGGRQAGETRTGAYTYICTDAVRFRASDGGACLLTEVPERVISEVLRDVDLLVSAAGTANKAASAGATAGSRRRGSAPRKAGRVLAFRVAGADATSSG
jgi:hypothetical protein